MSHPAKHERSSSSESAPRAVKKGRKDQPVPPQTPPRRTYQVRPLPDSSDDEDLPAPPRPQPPTRPKSGRPAHNDRAVRKDTSTAAEATLSGLVPPSPRTPPPKKPKEKKSGTAYSPFTTELLNFTTGLPIHLQASPNVQRTTSRTSTQKSAKVRIGLNNVRHSKSKGWTSAGRATTFSAYKRFEQWKNDYSPQQYALADCVDIIHAGNPLDRPKDIRARPVMFCWNTPDRRPPFAGKGTRFPVYRAKYRCTGHCRHGNDAPQSSDDESDSDSDDDDDNGGSASNREEPMHDDLADGGYVEVEDGDSSGDEDEDEKNDADSETEIDPSTGDIASLNKQLNSGAGKKAKTKGLGQHKCKVILHAEVYSDDLSEIHFFQRHTHPEALEKYLDTSHYIRQCMLEMASLFNLPPSSIKRRLLATFIANDTPTYRRPNASQVNNVVNYIRRKERVLSDPLLSIGVFAELNPDKIFCYTPPNYATDPPTEFATGIHHPYGTQVMILHSDHGIGHDTTWRNMNENRAPLTIMVTLDENGRMVPGFAYLSADIKIPTQVDFLRETKRLVEQMAADLIEGRAQVAAGLEHKKEELMAKARYIVTYGWQPAFFMIDKSRAAKAAIEQVFPGIRIRICQFHVMQAILRWDRDNAPTGERQPRPVLSLVRKHMLLQAVREAQRCRDIRRWGSYKARFRRRLDTIAAGSATTAETLWNYFEANWFCDEWLSYWTDMGLPEGANREGMLSTNNWTERAFKTFNQIFLGNRTNKSAYRLVLILANEWFQYYQAWPAQNRVNQEALAMAEEAYRVWSSTGTIREGRPRSDGRRTWTVARLPRVVRGQ